MHRLVVMMKQKRFSLMAYDRSPIGRMIIYKLAEIAIKTKEFDEATGIL